jgi:hypothetical protein
MTIPEATFVRIRRIGDCHLRLKTYKVQKTTDDTGSKYLWNVGELLSEYTVQQPRRQPSKPHVVMAIAVVMEVASTSETSVNFYQNTRHNNPEDSHLLEKIRFLSKTG